MPEGPEVKRCSEVIRDVIYDKQLSEVRAVSGKLQRLGIPNLDKLTFPAKVVNVTVRGKMIFIQLQGEYSIISTLGMSGWWYPALETITPEGMDQAYYAKVVNTVQKALNYTRVQLITTDGGVANYVDPRNFGNITVVTQSELEKRKTGLGLDFLNYGENPEYLQFMVKKFPISLSPKTKWGKMPLGALLLDQSFIAGLGNIYRAEVMYLARISPHRKGHELSEQDIKRILSAAEMVLNIAYRNRGTMIYHLYNLHYYLGDKVNVLYSMMQDPESNAVGRHLVYGWNKDPMGNPVTSESIGGRTCWWVPAIQA